MTQAIRRLFLIATLSIFVGCATVQNAKDSEAFTRSPDKTGLVVLSSTVNTGEIGQIQSFILSKIGEKPAKEFVLNNAISQTSRDTSVFIGALPPGEYRLVRLSAGMKFLDVSNSPILPNIKVAAGEIADLGRVILTAVNMKVALGRSRQFTDNRYLIKRYLPNKLELYNNGISNGWLQPPAEKDVIEPLALSHPQGAGSMVELADGRILAGTRLGTVLLRTTDKKWHIATRTKDYEAITAIAAYETNENLVIVADNYGELYLLDKNFELSPLERGNLPRGGVFFIAQSPDSTQWFIALTKDQHVELYSANALDNADWTLVRRDSVVFSAWSGARNAWAWNRPDGIGYAVSSENVINCYDYASRTWTKAATPANRTIIALASAPHTDAVGVLTSPGGGFAGVFAKTHLSRDCGTTWVETTSPYKVKASAPTLLPNDTIIEAGGVFRDTGIYALKPDANIWEKITDYVVLSERLWVMKSGGIFAVSQGQYGIENISFSPDGGATWGLELTSYSARFEKPAQKK
jgi:hypothetical protein